MVASKVVYPFSSVSHIGNAKQKVRWKREVSSVIDFVLSLSLLQPQDPHHSPLVLLLSLQLSRSSSSASGFHHLHLLILQSRIPRLLTEDPSQNETGSPIGSPKTTMPFAHCPYTLAPAPSWLFSSIAPFLALLLLLMLAGSQSFFLS